MSNENWGAIFREIRESKNVSLSKVAGDYKGASEYITSKQQVSRFELGESDITLTKISALLNNLGVSFEEYLYHVRGFKLEHEKNINLLLSEYQELNNLEMIEQWYLKFQDSEKWDKLKYKSYLALKSYKSYYITEDDIEEVSDYLFSVLNWGETELSLFGEFIPFLSIFQVFEFSQEIVKRTNFNSKSSYYRQQVILTIRDCVLYFIEKSEQKQAKIMLEIYKNLIARTTVDIYNRKEYMVVEGKYYFLIGDMSKGEKIFDKLYQIYTLLDYPKTAELMKSMKQSHK
ncbi:MULTISPECIES: Rgg/GadR/MutR family transcriptional regulator [unclassified Lactococcus]|uniref:Rgg/GadR/MutR family transcriptional regulator n=1 Tax=unclassified Lactococcus TaxID=2643510 RepID=UPI0011C89DF2|nr:MULTISPECIES: Rgg/GadR/MutR family transcriptional regulator [unclassified Lactococcus]MQW23057.1 helix-turn-helix domain-containing protein [Lactococcus sp. dk101]TXK44402.1 helix-turn-helix domain-containing protein [Lactococcus sp. dk310]TXK50212.1 helix-turn-helix domain-containing protein [Lactococcus sp. dk322]